MQNLGRSQTKGLSLELFHVQTNTSFDLPPNFSVIRLGKPKDQIIPDINIAGLPNADFVSRLHAEIQADKNTYSIVDVGSANGTYLNNIKLAPTKPHPLNFGDKIDLGHAGKVTFIFLQKQDVVPQSDNTILNNPPTVIQIELVANTNPSHVERLSKLVGLGLMVVGILILIANTQIALFVRIIGILLCIIGVVILTWRRTLRYLGWFLMALGITVMLFTGKALAPLSVVLILVSCALLVAGCQLFATGKILNYSLRAKNF